MKLKELHSLMQDMAPFDPARLKLHLEQYPTGPEIASRMLYTVRTPHPPKPRAGMRRRPRPTSQQAAGAWIELHQHARSRALRHAATPVFARARRAAGS